VSCKAGRVLARSLLLIDAGGYTDSSRKSAFAQCSFTENDGLRSKKAIHEVSSGTAGIITACVCTLI